MRKRLFILLLLSGAFASVAPSSVNAQVFSSGPAALAQQMPTIYAPYLANISRIQVVQKRERPSSPPASGSKRPVGQTPTKRPTENSPAAGDTTFHSTQPAFVPQQLAARLGKTKQERQYIESTLTKCLNFYIDTAKQKGVPLNDVTLALNYYIGTNYSVYSIGAGPTLAQLNATQILIHDNLVHDDVFRRMSDKQKQEAYETLIVLAGFVDLGFGTLRKSGDAKSAEPFREMAKFNLETLLGAPIEKISFTNDGLVVN